jgi:hypothetical protein
VDWEIIVPDTIKVDNDIAALLTKKIPRIQASSGRVCASPNPRCEFFSRIACAGEALLKRRIEGVVVACADSLCDAGRLSELMLDGRLKDPDNPYGILAGESGGAVCWSVNQRPVFAKRRFWLLSLPGEVLPSLIRGQTANHPKLWA